MLWKSLPLRVKGKQVGHHLTPGNILGKHLLGMSPQDRYDVFKGLLDMGRQHGMDPRQIIPLLDDVHFEEAHGKDFSGKKTWCPIRSCKR